MRNLLCSLKFKRQQTNVSPNRKALNSIGSQANDMWIYHSHYKFEMLALMRVSFSLILWLACSPFLLCVDVSLRCASHHENSMTASDHRTDTRLCSINRTLCNYGWYPVADVEYLSGQSQCVCERSWKVPIPTSIYGISQQHLRYGSVHLTYMCHLSCMYWMQKNNNNGPYRPYACVEANS